jgi:hypothetical protein
MVGSSDGGKQCVSYYGPLRVQEGKAKPVTHLRCANSMHAEDPVLMKKIKSVGKKLNLKKHLVCGHAVHTPGDLEGTASCQANPCAAASCSS